MPRNAPPTMAPTRLAALLATAAAACLLPAPTLLPLVAAAPEPSPLPRRWQLDIKTTPLRLITLPGQDGTPTNYLFFTYTVTNTSNTDLLFAPLFELATDAGDVVRSGRNVPLSVTRDLLNRFNNPELQDQISIVGNLLRGEENAKQGLVVWAAPTMHAAELVVYAAGFSGETTTVNLPDPATGDPFPRVLRKTLELRYRAEGDLTTRAIPPMDPYERRWVMR